MRTKAQGTPQSQYNDYDTDLAVFVCPKEFVAKSRVPGDEGRLIPGAGRPADETTGEERMR